MSWLSGCCYYLDSETGGYRLLRPLYADRAFIHCLDVYSGGMLMVARDQLVRVVPRNQWEESDG